MKWFCRAGWAAVAVAVMMGCEGTVEPRLTDGELIRQLTSAGNDESILFSTAVLFDQTGTLAFDRTADSTRRGLVPTLGFFDDSSEFQGSRLAWEGLVQDTLFGEIRFRVGNVQVTRSFNRLVLGGAVKFEKINTGIEENPWVAWRMQYRRGGQAAGDGSPVFTSVTLQSDSAGQQLITAEQKRLFRDTVLTLATGTLSSITVIAETATGNDSLFVTYPVAGGYETVAMTHTAADSLVHTAQVQVLSTRRFELLAVQAFKSQAFTDTAYAEATATAMRTAILAFR